MNKKERFCDVDNIVEWRHIITILLALVAMAGLGQVKCHVVGTVADGVERQTFYVAQQGTADDDDAKWTEVNVMSIPFTNALP